MARALFFQGRNCFEMYLNNINFSPFEWANERSEIHEKGDFFYDDFFSQSDFKQRYDKSFEMVVPLISQKFH